MTSFPGLGVVLVLLSCVADGVEFRRWSRQGLDSLLDSVDSDRGRYVLNPATAMAADIVRRSASTLSGPEQSEVVDLDRGGSTTAPAHCEGDHDRIDSDSTGTYSNALAELDHDNSAPDTGEVRPAADPEVSDQDLESTHGDDCLNGQHSTDDDCVSDDDIVIADDECNMMDIPIYDLFDHVPDIAEDRARPDRSHDGDALDDDMVVADDDCIIMDIPIYDLVDHVPDIAEDRAIPDRSDDGNALDGDIVIADDGCMESDSANHTVDTLEINRLETEMDPVLPATKFDSDSTIDIRQSCTTSSTSPAPSPTSMRSRIPSLYTTMCESG